MQIRTVGRITLWLKRVMTVAFPVVMVLALTARLPVAGQQRPPDTAQRTTAPALETAEQLQQLVAPIALYPDALVAQILAAATYPTQVVQADRWLEEHANLQGDKLAAAVDHQLWDPSVKALTAFPSVLANLDKNLSWTDALGDAYFNQQQDVLDALQVMRRRAEDAGNLKSSPQEAVIHEGPTIVIESARPDYCYLPRYDPWIVYGAPVAVYPGYFYDSWYGSPFISFGPAVGLGFFGGYGWGWPSWGFNWGRRVVVFNHNTYVSHSRYFNRGGLFIRGRGVGARRWSGPSGQVSHGFNNRSAGARISRFGNGWANRGSITPRANTGARSGAYNGTRPGGFNGTRPGTYNGTRPGAYNGARPGGFNGTRPGTFNPRPGYSGRTGVARPAMPSGGGGRNFGGGSRGGGSYGGGSHGGGGRHR